MKSKIFNIFSIIFLGSLAIFYSIRFIHFYKLEHQTYSVSTKLVDVIKNDSISIKEVDGKYIYDSSAKNNYVYYLGRMWRIVSIDEDIKLITDDVQTLLPNSDITSWLSTYEKTLKNIIDIDLLDISINNLLDEFNYLKSDIPYWIKCEDACFVDTSGKVSKDSDEMLGVRPVITISKDTQYTKGNGSINSPYEIEKRVTTNLSQAYVGEYINFSGKVWRIIEVGEKVKVALDEYIEPELSSYDRKTLINYLENDFYNSLDTKDILVGTYNVGAYDGLENIYSDTLELKVGTYTLGDIYINENTDMFTLTPYSYSVNTYYVVNEAGNIYVDRGNKHRIKPTIYLSNELVITDGDGMKRNPYKVGIQNED